jgi:CHASE2 domain-containing sensor protein
MIENALTILACLVIIVVTEPAINRMTRETPLMLRVGTWLICVGAVGAVVYVALGFDPPWPAVIGCVGVALHLVGERRARHRIRWVDMQRKTHG